MGVIPKKTTPLTKFIRTGEGVLVFAFNLTMLIVPIVSNSLSPEDAVKWAGIVNGVAVISRTGLKIVAEFSKSTGIQPQQIGDLSALVTSAVAAGNSGATDVVTAPVGPSDDEEFASTPTADDDDSVGAGVGTENGDQAGSLVSVGAGASDGPEPTVVNGGEQES